MSEIRKEWEKNHPLLEPYYWVRDCYGNMVVAIRRTSKELDHE